MNGVKKFLEISVCAFARKSKELFISLYFLYFVCFRFSVCIKIFRFLVYVLYM